MDAAVDFACCTARNEGVGLEASTLVLAGNPSAEAPTGRDGRLADSETALLVPVWLVLVSEISFSTAKCSVITVGPCVGLFCISEPSLSYFFFLHGLVHPDSKGPLKPAERIKRGFPSRYFLPKSSIRRLFLRCSSSDSSSSDPAKSTSSGCTEIGSASRGETDRLANGPIVGSWRAI